ncbi:sensor histidine kinase [Bacillus sp. SB49]|nr:sensor histidine kinase [Bacillus sp. SB49]
MNVMRLFPEKYGRAPLFWLIYMLVPLIALIATGGWEGGFGLLLLLVFFLMFRDMYWHPSRAFLDALGMTALLAVLLFFFHETFIYLSIYTTYSLYFIHKRWKIIVVYMLAPLLFFELYMLTLYSSRVIDFSTIVAAMILVAAIPVGIRNEVKSWNMKEQLSKANRRIEELVKQQERERIGRDLHDTVGQTLSMITLKSDIARRSLPDKIEQAEREIKEIHTISRTVLNQIREIVSDLKQLSFREELIHAEKLLREMEMEAVVDAPVPVHGLNPLYENILAYSLRESITNVIRHSFASRCTIRVEDLPEEVRMTISDDGIGFKGEPGNGLLGMEERLHMISGRMNIESAKQRGTVLVVHVPKVQK